MITFLLKLSYFRDEFAFEDKYIDEDKLGLKVARLLRRKKLASIQKLPIRMIEVAARRIIILRRSSGRLSMSAVGD